MSRFMKILAVAIVVFALGAGVAVWQRQSVMQKITEQAKATTETTPAPQTSAAAAPPAADSSTTASATPAPMPSAEPGQIVPNAPQMPASADASQAAAATPGSGDQTHDMSAMNATTPAPAQDAVAGMQAGGPFALTDHKGNAVTEKSWPGKYKLVFFGFTRCTDTCPATLQKISSVMEAYDPTATKLQPLFITTDPAFDTQQIMATYIGAYNGNILGLPARRTRSTRWKRNTRSTPPTRRAARPTIPPMST